MEETDGKMKETALPESTPKKKSTLEDDRGRLQLIGDSSRKAATGVEEASKNKKGFILTGFDEQPDWEYNKDGEQGVTYIKTIGTHVAEVKKVNFRARDKEIIMLCENEYERIDRVHNASGATIRIFSDEGSRLFGHYYVELLGSGEEVKHAERLIKDAMRELYGNGPVPRALMPTSVCFESINPRKPNVGEVLSEDTMLRLESETNVWIELEFKHAFGIVPVPFVRIYGESQQQVSKAVGMINDLLSEPSQ